MLQDLIYISLVADIIYSKPRCRRGSGLGRCTMYFCIQVGCDLDVDACGALTKSLAGGKKGSTSVASAASAVSQRGDCRRPGDFDGCVKMPRRRTCTMQTHKKAKAPKTTPPPPRLLSVAKPLWIYKTSQIHTSRPLSNKCCNPSAFPRSIDDNIFCISLLRKHS